MDSLVPRRKVLRHPPPLQRALPGASSNAVCVTPRLSSDIPHDAVAADSKAPRVMHAGHTNAMSRTESSWERVGAVEQEALQLDLSSGFERIPSLTVESEHEYKGGENYSRTHRIRGR